MTLTQTIVVPYPHDVEAELAGWLAQPFAHKVTIHTLDGSHLGSPFGAVFETVRLTVTYQTPEWVN